MEKERRSAKRTMERTKTDVRWPEKAEKKMNSHCFSKKEMKWVFAICNRPAIFRRLKDLGWFSAEKRGFEVESSGFKKPASDGVFPSTEGSMGSMEMSRSYLNEKDKNLAMGKSSFRAPPTLGFSSSTFNGGRERKEEPFNLDEFLRLAHAVIDDGDEKAVMALRDLKIKRMAQFRAKPLSWLGFPMGPPTGVGGRLKPNFSASPAKEVAVVDRKTTISPAVGGADGSAPATVTIPHRADVDSSCPGGVDDADLVEEERAAGVEDEEPADIMHDVMLTAAAVGLKTDDVTAVSMPALSADVNLHLYMKKMTPLANCSSTGLFVGNIPLHTNGNSIIDDKIAQAFNNSSRKTLSYIAPIIQNGEVVWSARQWILCVWELGVGKLLQLDIFWENDRMAMRKLKHTQVPVWIKSQHLPMEFWTTERLSTVARGVGKPLYLDAITRTCTRLDFARVCVMIDATYNLNKHIIVRAPEEDGGETPCKVDVEYEWLPPKCTTYMSLGHSAKDCALSKTHKPMKPPVNVYVPKGTVSPPQPPAKEPWDENVVDIQILDLAGQFIHCRVTNMAVNESIIITVVYGAFEVIDRRNLWTALETLAQQCSDIPWMVGGDFNAVRDLNEVCGISGDIRMATEEFKAGILVAGLIPLLMQGEWFTWHNCSTSAWSLWKRLDRILINDRWLTRFPSAYYHSLTPQTSDHSPLVLHGDIQQHNGCMFRFDNYLARSHEFIPNVLNIWNHEIVGIPMYAVTRKLKALKPVFRLQRRNKGDLTLNVQLAKGFLDEAQQLVSSDRQNELYLLLEHCCRIVYAKAAKLEQIMLQQRAKMQWMKDGDQCSRVFFRKIAQRRVIRRILQINDENGTTHTDQAEVAHVFVSYFQNLLGGTRRRLTVDIQYLRPWARHCITDEEASHLLLPFSPDDVKQAVFDIAEDKAPRPDGYSLGFFKAAWPVVGEEVTRAVLDFFSIGKLLKQINSAILTLIPKAYDTVEWDFLLAVLQLFGFPTTFTRWIEECVSTTSFSIGLNGKPHGFFPGARGLRQGDPLSPYLFVLVMEALHLGFLQRIEEDMQLTYHWKCESSKVFQLGFADDLLLFSRANFDSIRVFKEGLDWFAEVSGLRLNVHKSHLIISRSAQDLKDQMLEILGFQEGHLPMRTSIWVQWLYQDRLRDTSIWTVREHGGSCGWRKMLRLRPFLHSIVNYQIGDGGKFYIWLDPWHHLGPVIEQFPRGPNHLGIEESAKLNSVISAGELQWPPITDFECLEITHNLPFIFGGEDRVVWRIDGGQPTTQALYRLFDPPKPKVGWSLLLVGSLKIPHHSFILWLAILGKLPSTDKPWLSHLGACILCDEGATESHRHLFFRCRYSR
ncbi:UNVERIFIED_CONTAM: LINE-1 reverse transcriptase [Sesamum indicum]